MYTQKNPPKCPKVGVTTPVEYNGGKIYIGAFAFRVIRKLQDYYSERQFSHPTDKAAAWKHSLKAIDDYRTAERKA